MALPARKPMGGVESGIAKQAEAYTLVELTVVVFLIGLMLALTVPRLQHSVLHDDLKAATRRMMGVVRELREMAVRNQKMYRLHVDMESNKFWVEWDSITPEERDEAQKKASELPGDIQILDICHKETGKKTMGEGVVHFTQKGYVEYTVIHLGKNQEEAHTLILSPFLNTIKTHDRYVDTEIL